MASPARTAWSIAGVTLLIDQLTKSAVSTLLAPGQSVPLIPSVLHLTYVQNTGAAFGLLKGMTALFILLSLVVAVWIIVEVRSKPALPLSRLWALALVLGGAVGNLMDRVRHGYVVDFLDVRIWPVFNVADSAVTIGVGLLLLPLLLRRR